jgi:hypothetical protein
MTTASPEVAGDDSVSQEERQAALNECLDEFTVLWNERVNKDPDDNFDFITILGKCSCVFSGKKLCSVSIWLK